MSHIQKRLALLKRPPFLLYMLGFLFAAIGNGLGYIAMSWIVVSYHNSVTAMVILMASFWAPNVVLGPLMGVLADRLSRKWIIISSNFFRAIIFIFFSFYLKHHFHVATVYWMMFFTGVAFSAFFSSAMSFMRELVPEKDLMYANSTVDIIYEVGNVIGMGFAGFLIAWTSAETAIFINGLTFLIATISMLLISKKALCHGNESVKNKIRLFNDYYLGLRYLFQRKQLMSIYTIQLLIFITFLTAPLLLVPFSKNILHATVAQFGAIEAAASVGIVIGGIIMPWLADMFGLFKTLLIFHVVLCVTFLFFGYNRAINLAVMMYFVIGFASAVWPLIITKAQSLTELNFQGRVQSTFNSLSGALMMLFYLNMGYLGKYYDVTHLYLIEVAITGLAIAFLVRARNQF